MSHTKKELFMKRISFIVLAIALVLVGCHQATPTPDQTTRYFAYVTNQGDNTVSAYMINASSGALTAVSGSPFTAGSSPWAVAAVAVTGL
jgi:hypothetical protein